MMPFNQRADSRPRVYLRLIDDNGVPVIGWRAHPGAMERRAATVEDALGEALPDVRQPAVLLWEGLS